MPILEVLPARPRLHHAADASSAASAAPASPSPLGARSAHSSQAVPPSAGSAWDGGISTFPSAVSALSSSVAMGVSIARPALNLLAREISRGSPAAGGVFGNLIAHIGGSVATPPESSAAASRPAPQARAASPAPTDDAPARYFCDLCEVPIVRGLRWKCVVCPDWDACVSCFERITENETNASPLHDPTHPFLRILRPAHGDWIEVTAEWARADDNLRSHRRTHRGGSLESPANSDHPQEAAPRSRSPQGGSSAGSATNPLQGSLSPGGAISEAASGAAAAAAEADEAAMVAEAIRLSLRDTALPRATLS